MKKVLAIFLLFRISVLCHSQDLQTVTDAGNTSFSTAGERYILLGQSSTSGNSIALAWRYNNGAPYSLLESYGGGSPLVLQHSGGNVGIGTASPVYKLDVNGAFRSSYNGHYFMYNGAADVSMRYTERGTGGRAIVHGDGNTLVLNYGGDFSGGTILGANVAFAAQSGNSYINSGNVGIGTTAPGYKLDVQGNSNFKETATFRGGRDGGNTKWINFEDEAGNNLGAFKRTNNGLEINTWPGGQSHLMLNPTGNVAIGTTTPGNYKLAVEGIIGARKIKVTQELWPDYVFDSSYQLAPLRHVEKFIQTNKHLPDVPSATEVEKNGLDLGDNQAVLLKKIEELTLYIIQQNKQLNEQNRQMSELTRRVVDLEAKQAR